MQNNTDNKTKIRKYSGYIWVVCRIFKALLLFSLGGTGIIVFFAGIFYLSGHSAEHASLILYAWGLGVFAPAMLVRFFLYKNLGYFFGRLAEGHLFDMQAATRLLAVAKWYIVSWGIELAMQCLFLGFPSLEPIDTKPHPLATIIREVFGIRSGLSSAVVIFLVAWLYREALKLKEEQELTV